MHALLLSAGVGERLRPLTEYLPKCLLPATSEGSLLKYWVKVLDDVGVDRIYINVFWLKDKVKNYIRSDIGRPLSKKIYVYEEETLEPIGEVLYALRKALGSSFVIINSDTHIDKSSVKQFFNYASVDAMKPICLGTSFQENVSGKGLIEERAGIVCRFEEKPKEEQTGFVYAGIMMMHESVFNKYPKGMKKLELTKDILPHFVNKMTVFDMGKILDIGSSVPDYYKAFEELLLCR